MLAGMERGPYLIHRVFKHAPSLTYLAFAVIIKAALKCSVGLPAPVKLILIIFGTLLPMESKGNLKATLEGLGQGTEEGSPANSAKWVDRTPG